MAAKKIVLSVFASTPLALTFHFHLNDDGSWAEQQAIWQRPARVDIK